MVNFDELNSQSKQPLVIEPRQLFQTLPRDKQHEYLRDVQGDVLGEWHGRRDERDLVVKMNTGSGKTLVGLILLLSKLKEGSGPALYLCPNRHLASQVRREADSLGIAHVDFESNNLFPPEFHSSTHILITTVQRLFNGLSVFRVANRPNPVRVGTLLVDDAHACINIALEQFTATLPKTSEVGKRLSAYFDEPLKQQMVGTYADISQGKRNAYIRVPYWAWQQRLRDVAELFSKNADSEELKFVWPFLRAGEVLANSISVISGDRVEIAPNLIPIDLVPSFNDAPYRVFMSATLIDDASLVRDLGVDPKAVQDPIKPKVAGDIGERLIICPPLVDSRIEEITTSKLVSEIRSSHQVNVVVLVPSRNRARFWKTNDSMEVPGTDIADVIDQLSNSAPNTAIIANRYDGIDLPDEACRVLVIDDLPQEHRLARLIEATARHNSPILRRQTAQRIEQGMGRGVRSRADYCVVVLTGRSLVSFVTEVDNQSFFTEETKRQIEVGKKLSAMLKTGSTNAYQAILDLASQCLNRDQGWQKYHRGELQDIEADQMIESEDLSLASAELQAWQCALNGQYERAAQEIGSLINANEGLSDMDVGWYLQLQAEYLHHVDQTTALEKQLKAHDLNRNLLKPPTGVNYRKIQAKQTEQASVILDWVKRSNEQNALVSRANEVLDSLTFGVPHDLFEDSLSKLANIVGFQSQRPEAEANRGPDVLWWMTNDHYLIIEAKQEVNLNRDKIYKSEAEQLGHSVTWFEYTYPGKLHTALLLHPTANLADDAYLPEDSRVVQVQHLEELVKSVREFITALASRPASQWSVSEISSRLETYKLRPSDFLSLRLGTRAIRQARP